MSSRVLKRAVIYCRQSSGKEEDSESLGMQEEACRVYAESHGWDVIGVYADANTPGRLYPTGAESLAEMDEALAEWLRSHTTGKRYRAGLGQVLEMLSQMDCLLVYDLTRLYRPVLNSFLQAYVNHRLLASRVELVSLKEGTIDFQKFTDALVSSIQSQVNDNQIKITREKSKKALARLRDSGYYCTQPKMFGIRYLGGKEKRIEVIPEAVEVIRFVYEQVLHRAKYADLLREMNTRFRGRHSGKCFYDTSWRHIIANPFYCGYMYDSHGVLVPAKQMEGKEIVTFEEWHRANEIVNASHGGDNARHRAQHPFSGLLYCGNCGSRMSVLRESGKICYSCLQGVNVRHDKQCGKSRVNITLVRSSQEFTGLREAVLPVLPLALFLDSVKCQSSERIQAHLEETKSELQEIEGKIGDLVDSFVENETSRIAYYAAFQHLQERKTTLLNEIVLLTHQASQAQDNANALKTLQRILDNQLSEESFRTLLHRAVSKIHCFEDHLDIHTHYGILSLPRVLLGSTRNFPKFSFRILPRRGKQPPTTIQDCLIQVNYLFPSSTEHATLLAHLASMDFWKG
ncbi:MAG: recombinase family protein [Victivallales bacterium]|nr:recombinase family protein [Victivallales bacterium]